MTDGEARKRAQQHLETEPLDHPDYRWRLGEGVEQPDGWYFDFTFEPVRPLPESEWEQFCGAPGFVVPSDGSEIRVLSWEDFAERELSGGTPAPDPKTGS